MAVAVGIVGVVVVGTLVHGNSSPPPPKPPPSPPPKSKWSEHSNTYTCYGDAEVRRQKANQERKIKNKENEIENLRKKMNDNYNERISALKREKNYSALDKPVSQVIDSVKKEMRHEIEDEIKQENQKLAEIDKMIARINEIELQSRKG